MNKQLSLVEQAKAVPANARQKTVFSKEEEALTVAWMNDEIALKQVGGALKKPLPQCYIFLALCAKQIWKRGK